MPPTLFSPLLQDWHIVSLRPAQQHSTVRHAAARWGAVTFALSTLRLQALEAKPALRDALACPRVIVTSPAAVRFAQAQHVLKTGSEQCWFALGEGSAAALQRVGIKKIKIPQDGAHSEALLAHKDLQQVRGEAIGLITAPGGRGLIAETLRKRGAIVHTAEVYERIVITPSMQRLRILQALPKTTALFITSSEALLALWQVLDARAQSTLVQRPCVVSSARLQTQAQALGFIVCIRAQSARPTALLTALAEHVSNADFR